MGDYHQKTNPQVPATNTTYVLPAQQMHRSRYIRAASAADASAALAARMWYLLQGLVGLFFGGNLPCSMKRQMI